MDEETFSWRERLWVASYAGKFVRCCDASDESCVPAFDAAEAVVSNPCRVYIARGRASCLQAKGSSVSFSSASLPLPLVLLASSLCACTQLNAVSLDGDAGRAEAGMGRDAETVCVDADDAGVCGRDGGRDDGGDGGRDGGDGGGRDGGGRDGGGRDGGDGGGRDSSVASGTYCSGTTATSGVTKTYVISALASGTLSGDNKIAGFNLDGTDHGVCDPEGEEGDDPQWHASRQLHGRRQRVRHQLRSSVCQPH
jgi:hypothetical protein